MLVTQVSTVSSTLQQPAASVNHSVNNAAKKKVPVLPSEIGTDYTYKRNIIWRYALGSVIIHVGALCGIYLMPQAYFKTLLWTLLVMNLSTLGITMGCHRLFCHKSYKATAPLRTLLVCLQSIAGQNSCYYWSLVHRLHHKYSDTDADPHNANLGFWFSHLGWTMVDKHPIAREKSKTIDMSDLKADPICMFQHKYFNYFYFMFAFFIPTFVPIYYWDETLINSVCICFFFRYCSNIHITFTVNSVGHFFGNRPYDRYIKPAENGLVSKITLGEGWHNYHHAFPFDYRAAEFGPHWTLSTFLIDCFASIGWAYDLRTTTPEMLLKRQIRTGEYMESGDY